MALGSWVSLLDWRMSLLSSRNLPTSLGTASRWFSSSSSTLNLLSCPIPEERVIKITVIKYCYDLPEGSLRRLLLERINTSRLESMETSSGILVSWLVPRFSSTMLVQVPMSMGSEVNWFSFMLSFWRYLALEKMPYGILSQRLCSMLRVMVLMNCAGPPEG